MLMWFLIGGATCLFAGFIGGVICAGRAIDSVAEEMKGPAL